MNNIAYLKSKLESLSPEWRKVLDEIISVYAKRGISEDEVFNQLLNIYELTKQINAPDDERLIYSIRLLKAKSIQQLSRPTTTIYILPVGITAPAYSRRRGSISANLIGLVLEQNSNPPYKPVVVKLYDQAVNFLDEIEPFRWYRLGVIKGSRLYIATSQSTLEKDSLVANTYEQVLNIIMSTFQPKRISIRDGRKFASRTFTRTIAGGIEREFVDPLDTRLVSGIVLRGVIRKDEQTGLEKGLYIITDDSAPPYEQLDEEGYPIPMNMFVWCHRKFMVYDTDSQLIFFGTVRYLLTQPQQTTAIEETNVGSGTESTGEQQSATDADKPIRPILTMNAYWVFPTPFVKIIK